MNQMDINKIKLWEMMVKIQYYYEYYIERWNFIYYIKKIKRRINRIYNYWLGTYKIFFMFFNVKKYYSNVQLMALNCTK